MSIFCGKCDVRDMFYYETEEEMLESIKNTRFIIDDVETEINSIKELVPYYPCVLGIATYNGETKGGTCMFSSKSYADKESNEIIQSRYENALRSFKRLKRKKMDITAQNIYDGYYHFGSKYKNVDGELVLDKETKDEIDWEICKRIERDGEYAITNDLCTNMSSIYRYYLYEEMIRVGYTEKEAIMWVYEHKKTW